MGDDKNPVRGIDVVWGKSFGGRHHLLAHLLDAAAVAELIYDRYLTPAVRLRLATELGGDDNARTTLMWLAGVHDIGKCTPAFQSKHRELGEAVRATELTWVDGDVPAREWPHGIAGGRTVHDWMSAASLPRGVMQWLSAVVAGHHGVFCDIGEQQTGRGQVPRPHGRAPAWREARELLLARVTDAVGFDPERLPAKAPPVGAQTLISGLVIMADWIASASEHFPPLAHIGDVTWAQSRLRADNGWAALQLGEATALGASVRLADVLDRRFGFVAHPFQLDVVRAALEMDGPGIIVVEAPMGEGKTEAALAAAEVLCHRQELGGVFVGLPTQATADPMFDRVKQWLSAVAPHGQIALVHGKASFNRSWSELLRKRPSSINIDDAVPSDAGAEAAAAAQWFLGHKRSLLAPTVVGTVDQLLLAGARVPHVVLRHAGLANKVVIVDEVHAADVYMSVFLRLALWWLGSAGVPVILLSATLPPSQRREFIRHYCAGALRQMPGDRPAIKQDAAAHGYPLITLATAADDALGLRVWEPTSTRIPAEVRVTVLGEVDGDELLRAALRERLAGGGCAAVVRNTVARAQATAQALRGDFGDDVMLLHARYTVTDRAERSARLLAELGPRGMRPARRVVVATQVVEQSLDIDADLLVSDLAPIDLLLQRVGRMHRHQGRLRPERLSSPELIVTGMAPDRDGPRVPRGSTYVYALSLLLKTGIVVQESPTWTLPRQIPSLVAEVYEERRSWPVAVVRAAEQADRDDAERIARARAVGLDPTITFGRGTSLHSLHRLATGEGDEAARIVVRDGHVSREVVLVRSRGDGWLTVHGTPLDRSTEPGQTVTAELLGDVVRLPYEPGSLQLEQAPPAWAAHPWLGDRTFLVLDDPATGGATYGPDGLVLP